jgi:hypothetical protein
MSSQSSFTILTGYGYHWIARDQNSRMINFGLRSVLLLCVGERSPAGGSVGNSVAVYQCSSKGEAY